MSSIQPTNPFHISRAYQSAPAGRASGSMRVSSAPTFAGPSRPGAMQVSPSATGGSVTPQMNVNTKRLVAGSVPGKVDFTAGSGGGGAVANTTAIPFYRHPADKNAAATGVSAGRMVDVNA